MLLCWSVLLVGCGSKTSFSITFDEFSFKFYDNNKQYITLPSGTSSIGMKVLTEMKEKTVEGNTGFINSLIIIRMPIQSWISIKQLVESNTNKLQLNLLKYKSTDNASKKVKCDDLQYSWYVTAFSYLLDNQSLYGGQYFFIDEQALYLLSLSSDDQKDITSFIKSIWTLKCN